MGAKIGAGTDRDLLKDKFLRLALQLGELGENVITSLDEAVQASLDRMPWAVQLLKPRTFAEFLVVQNLTQGLFNQLVSEVPWEILLDQVEVACFLQPDNLVKAQPFISGLWEDEVVKQDLFKPPAGWCYLPVEEAVEAFKKIFGSGVMAISTTDRAKNLKPRDKSEGIAVWPSLSFLLHYFEIPEFLGISKKVKPWEDTKDSRAAYAKIVDLFIPEVGKVYNKAYPQFSFKNWREGALTAEHILLTSAGQRAWQELESRSDDDFVAAPANSGSLYVGHSVRGSRVKVIMSANQFGQDCIMAGGTLMVQPGRLTKYEDLGIDCPANSYSSGADRNFADSVSFYWDARLLHFHYHWAVNASRIFGSAVGCRG